MFIKLNRKKAQSTMEYALVIGVVVAALLAINIYIKRAAEGRLKSSVDQIGEQFDAHKTSVFRNETTTGYTRETSSTGGVSTTTSNQTTTVYGNEVVGNWL